MKKVLPIFLLLLSVAAFGQKQVYFGLSGSGISTWITNQNNYGLPPLDYAMKFSWAGNVDIGIDFSKHFGIKTEVGMAFLGQNYIKDGDTNITRHVKTNYLTVPLLLKYRTGGDMVRFYLLAGVQAGFLLHAEQVYTKGGEPFRPYYNEEMKDSIDISKTDITDRFNSFQLFVRLDPGVEISITDALIIHAGLTFNYGLLDINASAWQLKDSDGNYNPSHNLYAGLNVGIAYAIPIGRK